MGIIPYTHPPKQNVLTEERKVNDTSPVHKLAQDVALHN
jgi:hypothetical protein